MSERSQTEIETKMDIEEEFCGVMEDIKSEEAKPSDIKPVMLPKYHESHRYEKGQDVHEVLSQSNDDEPSPMLCRICAIANDDMVDIFYSCDETEENILGMINDCLPIVVRIHDCDH